MMQFLHISITFEHDVDEESLRKVFDKAVDWAHYAPNCWIVRTSSDEMKWFRRLEPLLKEKDTLLIVKVDLKDRVSKLPDFLVDWLKHYSP